MIVGDVITQSVVRVDRPNVSATFKPEKGNLAVLLLLGSVGKNDIASFSGEKALSELGWVRCEKYAEMKTLLTELLAQPTSCGISEFNTRIDKVLQDS